MKNNDGILHKLTRVFGRLANVAAPTNPIIIALHNVKSGERNNTIAIQGRLRLPMCNPETYEMAETLLSPNALDCPTQDVRPASWIETHTDQCYSKPFRGIIFGVVIVTPFWAVIGTVIYFVF